MAIVGEWMKLDTKSIDRSVVIAVAAVVITLIAAVTILGAIGRPAQELISLIQLVVTGYVVVSQRQTDAKVDQVARQTNGTQTTAVAMLAATNPNVDPARVAALQATTAPGVPGPAGPQGATGATGPAGPAFDPNTHGGPYEQPVRPAA